MQKQIDTKVGFAIIAGATVVFLAIVIIGLKVSSPYGKEKLVKKTFDKASDQVFSGEKEKIVRFTSVADFKEYLEKAGEKGLSYFGRGGGMGMPETVGFGDTLESRDMASSLSMEKSAAPQAEQSRSLTSPAPRYSETNVQMLGIDEPDIVKNDGKEIYFSQPEYLYEPMPLSRNFTTAPGAGMEEFRPAPDMIIPPEPRTGKVKLIEAYPPQQAEISSEITKSGDLLLSGNILMVFSDFKRKIYGYDVSDPTEPREKWTVEIKDQDEIVGARLYGDKVFLATRSFLNYDTPCPYEPIILNGDALKLSCESIYHPVEPVPVDITYNLISFNAKSGQLEESTSFVGSSSKSVLYMSEDSIYLTYEYPGNYTAVIADFFNENRDLIPASVTDRIKNISDYDLSDNAKNAELNSIIEKYTRGLSRDELMRVRNEFSNRLDEFVAERARELEYTGIIKVSVPTLMLTASGKVTGSPLNQFSLDEYEYNLRIATTFTGNLWLPGGLGGASRSNQGASDVFVLNDELDEIGSVQNLGVGERIYSVRFIEDKGYVVTFKQIDPFFVLDLANPRKPLVKGELKIPGFSSYLHPLGGDKILGVGQEEGKVKLTVFDVNDPGAPQELDTYHLDEYWTEVSDNHHAFLIDKKHGIFFLPGGSGGYVFSYVGDRLGLKKTVSDSGVKRAVYIGDYLYILGDTKMTVLSENDWEKVEELEL